MEVPVRMSPHKFLRILVLCALGVRKAYLARAPAKGRAERASKNKICSFRTSEKVCDWFESAVAVNPIVVRDVLSLMDRTLGYDMTHRLRPCLEGFAASKESTLVGLLTGLEECLRQLSSRKDVEESDVGYLKTAQDSVEKVRKEADELKDFLGSPTSLASDIGAKNEHSFLTRAQLLLGGSRSVRLPLGIEAPKHISREDRKMAIRTILQEEDYTQRQVELVISSLDD